MWNLKHDTNEPIYEAEIESGRENRLLVPRGRVWERDGIGGWG